jgi:hypothetical protein
VNAGVRDRAYELRGTLATVLPLFGVDAAGVRLIGWADGDCVKMRGLGCCCWIGMRHSSPGQRPRLWGRVSQRAKAVVLVDVVALVALDLATPPTWSDPGGPALQLHLARRVNYRRGEMICGTTQLVPLMDTPQYPRRRQMACAPESFMDAGGSSRCADPKDVFVWFSDLA